MKKTTTKRTTESDSEPESNSRTGPEPEPGPERMSETNPGNRPAHANESLCQLEPKPDHGHRCSHGVVAFLPGLSWALAAPWPSLEELHQQTGHA